MMIFAICVLLQILLHYNNHTVIGKSQRCISRFHLFLPIYRVISRSIFFIRNSVKYKIYTTDGIDINCYIIIIMYKVYISCKKNFYALDIESFIDIYNTEEFIIWCNVFLSFFSNQELTFYSYDWKIMCWWEQSIYQRILKIYTIWYTNYTRP